MNDCVLAIDPGKITGVALWLNGEILHTDELKFIELRDWLEVTLDTWTKVVIEKFVINSMTAKLSQAPWSLEVIGMLRDRTDDNLIFQTPAQAKRAVSNEMLMKLRWWHPGGAGHALDALRHLVFYLMQQREPQLLARLDELNL